MSRRGIFLQEFLRNNKVRIQGIIVSEWECALYHIQEGCFEVRAEGVFEVTFKLINIGFK